jgi:hypothetical protein
MARAVPREDRRGDDGDDPPRPRAARHPPRRVLVRGRAAARGKPEAAEAWLREHGLGLRRLLEAPKGKTLEDWEPVELPLFRSTRSATTRTARSARATAAGPTSAPTSPITCRRRRAPTS